MAVLAHRSMAMSSLKTRMLTGRSGWILLGAFWLVTRLIYLLNVMLGHHYPDEAFFLYAQRFSTGLLPYRDFPVEYPPLGIALIVLPGLVHSGPLTEWLYSTSFALEMLALDLLTLFLVVRLARGLIPRDRSGLFSGLLYTAFVAASGAIAQKFDLVAGTFCLIAVVALVRRRDGLAWVMLMLAVLAKGFPLALAPLFIFYRLMEGRAGYRGLYEGLRAGFVSTVLVGVPLLLVTGIQPLVYAVVYHADRGVEIESMYAGILLVCGRILNLTTTSYFNLADQSQDIASPLEGLVGGFAVPLGIVLIGLLYWQFYRALKSRPDERDVALVRSTLLIMLAFMITFRALPGHYLLAILPLAALVRFRGERQHVFVVVLLGALLLGQLETVVWLPLLAGRWVGILALVARNSAILATFGVLLGGRMQRFTSAPTPAARRPLGARPKPSLGWAVESGVRSWQEVSVPLDSYRERVPSLLPMQHLYVDYYRQLLR
jgi:hypothetical protein